VDRNKPKQDAVWWNQINAIRRSGLDATLKLNMGKKRGPVRGEQVPQA
jgi:hypothetical protein